MISFVVPAHNEAAGLGPTLAAIHTAARAVGEPYELIVVDDASTDRTPEIAREGGAKVVSVAHRHIAATRNSGARAAQGEFIFFIDADTLLNADVVRDGLAAMRQGAAGGGAWTRFGDPVPLYAQAMWLWLVAAGHVVGFVGGACMFCTRAAFQGGARFDENVFGGEEWGMALAVKRIGPFVVLWKYAITSGRRFRQTSPVHLLTVPLKIMLPSQSIQKRASVQKIWYESDRSKDQGGGKSWGATAINALALVVFVVVLAAPWVAVAAAIWSSSMPGSFGSTVKVVSLFIAVHVGLQGWPFAVFLGRGLARQVRWAERLRLGGLALACLALAVLSTWQAGVMWRALFARLSR